MYLSLSYLHKGEERKNISRNAIAAYFGINDVQVRKDLGIVSGTGRPRTGMLEDLYCPDTGLPLLKSDTKAVLVGVGNIGKALLSYSGFADYGLKIVAAFDGFAPLWVHT